MTIQEAKRREKRRELRTTFRYEKDNVVFVTNYKINYWLNNQLKLILIFLLLLLISFYYSIEGLDLSSSEFQSSSLISDDDDDDLSKTTLNVVESDEHKLYLLALFDIHRAYSTIQPFRCGPIDLDAGQRRSLRSMQNLEAFLWAIESVNSDDNILPGIRLGSVTLDTCSSFLRTNQEFANLLHGQYDNKLALESRQIIGVVADQQDWRSVEAVTSIASSLNITTFVTQCKSTKLSESLNRYEEQRTHLMMENLDMLEGNNNMEEQNGKITNRNLTEGEESLLESLGIGRQIPSDIQMQLEGYLLSKGKQRAIGELALADKLYMIRMPLTNEHIAEALVALLDKLNWHMISVIYDDEPEMVDLHDEFARQLVSRQTQMALDEQITTPLVQTPIATTTTGESQTVHDKIIKRLIAKCSHLGSRVVVSLLDNENARLTLEALKRARIELSIKNQTDQLNDLNSLLWIAVSDREPFYSMATDALGTIVLSGSSSLNQAFRSYYENLSSENHSKLNRWWPEYLRSILLKHKQDIELLSNECAKWQEPKLSQINEKCRTLNLRSLISGSSFSSRVSQSSEQQSTVGRRKLTKYLANGWEHNGMDVINSVWAMAKALDKVRRSICPDTSRGLCEKMLKLIEQQQQQQQDQLGSDQLILMPTLSELMYEQLRLSAFQLPDGKLFSINEFDPSGFGQFETKVKFYNLRYLQANSIGFVKFGHYDQRDGLKINTSKTRHYPTNSFNFQLPIDQVKSSCNEEGKCLSSSITNGQSLSSLADQANKRDPLSSSVIPVDSMSEEELAMGLNSLFKLDHPLISGLGDLSRSEPKDLSGSEQQAKQQQQHITGATLTPDESIHLIRTSNQANIDKQFVEHLLQQQQQHSTSEKREQDGTNNKRHQNMFNMIVLLPLHKKSIENQDEAKINAETNLDDCPIGLTTIDVDHSFQHLIALAYGLTKWEEASREPGSLLASDKLKKDIRSNVEMTATVIDYCGQPKLAEKKLANLLRTRNEASTRMINGKSLFVLDFDEEVGERIDELVGQYGLVHLTLDSISNTFSSLKSSKWIADANQNLLAKQTNHLHLNLLPSKYEEISALVKILSSVPTWKLVHLIYTDDHHYRDEFVRQANEANICVSKLIWIPKFNELNQVDKVKSIFSSEIHDFHDKSFTSTSSSQEDGLNSTRVIVVLASSHEPTNRLILEASTQSMLEDYAWLTTHEWLNSVEIPIEMKFHTSSESTISTHQETPPLLPRNLISTKLETFETHEFKHYFSSLSPAIHAPIPTGLFDLFWQTYHKCKLPLKSAKKELSIMSSEWPNCQPSQYIEGNKLVEDDRVFYVIKAIDAIYQSVESMITRHDEHRPIKPTELAQRFKALFSSNRPDKLEVSHKDLPYGFQIIHRLNVDKSPNGEILSKSNTRRQNSRNIDISDLEEGQLQVIGFWRDNKLTLSPNLDRLKTKQRSIAINVSSSDGDSDQSLLDTLIGNSFSQMTQLESRCQTEHNCKLCEAQISQTKAINYRAEAHSLLELGSSEPKAISSIRVSSLDIPASPIIVSDVEISNVANNPQKHMNASRRRQLDSSRLNETETETDPLSSAASSMFDSETFKRVENNIASEINSVSLGDQNIFMLASVNRSQFGVSSALFLSAISLTGIVCTIVSMTHLYPNAIDQRWAQDKFQRQLDRSFDYVNDYFLLTGLLMLYSINVAFLLPATMGICWFRRIGLATSYTILYSSILVKLIHCIQRDKLRKVNKRPINQSDMNGGDRQLERQPEYETIDENPVELTFESLPPEIPSTSLTTNQILHETSVGHVTIHEGTPDRIKQIPDMSSNQSDPPFLLLISTGLIVVQMIISLIWFIQQPPEPTLFNSCWHCFSPSRSPILFLYEPVLSLLYPASLLVLAWFYSMLNYRQALKKEVSLQPENKRLFPAGRPTPRDASSKILPAQEALDRWLLKTQLRDSKSLVMSTSLLILTWSLVSLTTISTNKIYNPLSSANTKNYDQDSSSSDELRRSHTDNLNLVYANIISGAIIFTFLFLYRHNLLSSILPLKVPQYYIFKRSRGSKSLMNTVSSQNSDRYHDVIKYNQSFGASTSLQQTCESPSSVVFVGGSQFQAPQGQERLRIQQFSEFYGSTFCSEDAAKSRPTDINLVSLGSYRRQNQSTSRRKLVSPGKLLFGSSSSLTNIRKVSKSSKQNNSSKLRRQESSGSVTSSTANLISRRGSIAEADGFFLDGDTISVASSSTSQLQGNDLYPIDCSIQFEYQQSGNPSKVGEFERGASIRRSTANRLNSVKEETQTRVEDTNQTLA